MIKRRNSTERMLALVQKTAMLAVEMPPAEREKYLSEKKAQYLEDARSVSGSESFAQLCASKMDEWVRAMVQIIEQSGSAGGGKA